MIDHPDLLNVQRDNALGSAGPTCVTYEDMSRLLIAVILCLMALGASGQEWISLAHNNMQMRRIDLNEFLDGATITTLYEGPRGFLWIGTRSGLYRYDGTHVKPVSGTDSCMLAGEQIRTIKSDGQGRLWLGLEAGGLFVYDLSTSCFSEVRLNLPEVPYPTITCFYQQNDSVMWAGSTAHGLMRTNLMTLDVTRVLFNELKSTFRDNWQDNSVTSIRKHGASDHLAWLACQDGIRLFDMDKRLTHRFYPLSFSVNDIFETQDGNLLLATWGNGIASFNIRTSELTYHNDDRSEVVLQLTPKSSTQVWAIAYYQPLRYFDVLAQAYVQPDWYNYPGLNDPEFLTYQPWKDAFRFHDRVYFLSGENIIYQLSRQINSTRYSDLPSASIKQTTPSRIVLLEGGLGDQVYASISGPAGIYTYNAARNAFDPTRIPSPSGRTNTILFFLRKLDNGHLITSTHDGLFIVDTTNMTVSPFEEYYRGTKGAGPNMRSHFYDAMHSGDRYLYVIDNQYVVYAFDLKSREWLRVSGPGGVSPEFDEHVYGFEPSGDTIFVFTYQGLGFMTSTDPALKPIPAFYDKPRRSFYIHNILVHGDVLWINDLYKGLSAIERKSFRTVAQLDLSDLPTKRIHTLKPGAHSSVWLGTNKGIYRLNRDLEIDLRLNDKYGLEFNFWDKEFAQISEDTMIVSGLDKFGVLSISTLERQRATPGELYLDKISMGETVYHSLDHFRHTNASQPTLPFTARNVEVSGSVIDLTGTAETHVQYRLTPLTNAWAAVEEMPFHLRFPALPPGDYALEMITSTNEHIEASMTQIGFGIRIPFYRSWMFWLTVALIVTGVAGLFFYQRIRYRLTTLQTEAAFQNKLLATRMEALQAKMNPHFIFNTLNSIKLLIQKQRTEDATRYLHVFSSVIRKVLQSLEMDSIPLTEELDILQSYLELEALRFGDAFSFSIVNHAESSLEDVFIPPLVLQPFVENAVWHGLMHKEGERRVEISVDPAGDDLVVSIYDNGIGRKRSAQHNHRRNRSKVSMGLDLIQSRIDVYNAMHRETLRFAIDEGPREGTLVRLFITRQKTHQHVEGDHH